MDFECTTGMVINDETDADGVGIGAAIDRRKKQLYTTVKTRQDMIRQRGDYM